MTATLQLTHLAAARDQHTNPTTDPDTRCQALRTIAARARTVADALTLCSMLGLDPITDRCTLGRMEVDE